MLFTSAALEINTVEINTYEAVPNTVVGLKREDCGEQATPRK
jgi:hypothetical protein